MNEHNKKARCVNISDPVMALSPGNFCAGLGVQASKETARKLKFGKLLSLR